MMYNENVLIPQFNSVVAFARSGVDLLIEYHDSYAYGDMGDDGNTCWKPYQDEPRKVFTVNMLIGAVRQAMPKNSIRHKKLSSLVAADLNLSNVHYDWLCKATARLLVGIKDTKEIEEMGKYSRNIRRMMAEKGQTEIGSLSDLI